VATPVDPRLFPYADHVLDRIDAEAEIAAELRAAVQRGEGLVLDLHPHSSGAEDPSGVGEWCAAIRLESNGRDLVHLRGVVRERDQCAPFARALAGLLTARHRLPEPPRIVVAGAPVFV
jgi:hypothetical protein